MLKNVNDGGVGIGSGRGGARKRKQIPKVDIDEDTIPHMIPLNADEDDIPRMIPVKIHEEDEDDDMKKFNLGIVSSSLSPTKKERKKRKKPVNRIKPGESDGKRRLWTEEEDAELLAAVAQGMSWVDIGKLFVGRVENAAYKRYTNRLKNDADNVGHENGIERREWTEEEDDALLEGLRLPSSCSSFCFYLIPLFIILLLPILAYSIMLLLLIILLLFSTTLHSKFTPFYRSPFCCSPF
jgi:hypothetical protein